MRLRWLEGSAKEFLNGDVSLQNFGNQISVFAFMMSADDAKKFAERILERKNENGDAERDT